VEQEQQLQFQPHQQLILVVEVVAQELVLVEQEELVAVEKVVVVINQVYLQLLQEQPTLAVVVEEVVTHQLHKLMVKTGEVV